MSNGPDGPQNKPPDDEAPAEHATGGSETGGADPSQSAPAGSTPAESTPLGGAETGQSTPGDGVAGGAEAGEGESVPPASHTPPTSADDSVLPAGAPPDRDPTAVQPSSPTGRSGQRVWLIAGLAVLLCLLVVIVGLVLALGDDDDADSTGDPGTEQGPDTGPDAGPGAGQVETDPEDHTVTAAVDGREEAELHVVSGAQTVEVRAEEIGDDLYRVSTPTDGHALPRVVEEDGRFEVHLDQLDRDGPSQVELLLNSEVSWTLSFTGGASEQRLDLTAGSVAGLVFEAGASVIEVQLPEPDGIVPIEVTTGAGDLLIEVPAEVPVRAHLSVGAGQVDFDGESETGVPAHSEFTTEGWDGAEDGYEIESAGLGELIVTRRT